MLLRGCQLFQVQKQEQFEEAMLGDVGAGRKEDLWQSAQERAVSYLN